MFIDSATLSNQEQYKLLIGSVIPRPVALLSSLSETHTLNIAPFSYFNIVSTTPPIVSISILRKNGQLKDTARNILEQKEAVVHILSENILQNSNETAANLPADKSELDLTTFTLSQSETIETPGITEAFIRFETTLFKHIPITEKDQATADLFLLNITGYHFHPDVIKDGKIIATALNPISRLAGNDYAALGPIQTIKRPK